MSHLVTLPVQVLHPEGVERACSRLNLLPPLRGKTLFFDGQEREGLLVQLPGWSYPVCINTQTGEVDYDNYNGAWGVQEQLDQFLQAYAVETAKMAAEAQGYQVEEELLADGSVHLNVLVTH